MGDNWCSVRPQSAWFILCASYEPCFSVIVIRDANSLLMVLQVLPELVRVQVKTEEDKWAVRFLNAVLQMRQIMKGGITRELLM